MTTRPRCLLAPLATAAVAVLALVACDNSRAAPSAPSAPVALGPAERAPLAFASPLLSCPRSETRMVSTYVDSTGGRLDLDGNAVVFPAGAVPTRAKFTLKLPAGPHDRIDVYANETHGYRFATPVEITISLRGCLLSAPQIANTTVWYVDDTDALLEPMGGAPDSLTGAIRFTTPHLSGYSVAYRSAEAPADSTSDDGAGAEGSTP
jgi:hypothetical protein